MLLYSLGSGNLPSCRNKAMEPRLLRNDRKRIGGLLDGRTGDEHPVTVPTSPEQLL